MAMSSNTEVRVLDVTYIPLLQPPPPHLEHVKLSFFDAWYPPLPPIKRCLFYEGDSLPAFPSLLQSLKSSLAATIARFFPLAGKLTYVPSSGDVVIDCSPSAVGAGVAFLEAEADGDVRRLAGNEEHDVPAFLRLIPRLDTRELPAPVFAVQVTQFAGGGGVAVGVAVHHAVVDGQSLWQFMEAWSAACRGVSPAAAAPTFDRAVIVHPRGEEIARDIVRRVAPDLPLLPNRANAGTRPQLDTRTLVLDRERIQELKKCILQLNQSAHQPQLQAPSTLVAVAALVWTSIVRARSMNSDDRTHLLFFANCRARLRPPVAAGYFGNCIQGCFAEAVAGDLLGENGLLHASLAIQKAIREFLEQPLAGCEVWFDRYIELFSQSKLITVPASPQFRVYETDFGWGKPSRVEFVLEGSPDGWVVLTGGREEGSVQMTPTLNPINVQGFKSQILNF